jgi:hypothetical protein
VKGRRSEEELKWRPRPHFTNIADIKEIEDFIHPRSVDE